MPRGDQIVIHVTPWLTIPAGELSMSFARSGGSGGQNVNKVSSKVDLRWNVETSAALRPEDREWLLQKLRSKLTSDGTLIVTSTLTRDQIKNRDDAESKTWFSGPTCKLCGHDAEYEFAAKGI